MSAMFVGEALVIEGALGLWLGIQAFRAFMLVTVWNTPGEDAPASELGLVALVVFSIGLAAWLPARRACRVNPIVALRAE